MPLGERGTAARAVSRREHSWPSGVEEFVADPNDPEGLARPPWASTASS